MGRTLGQEGSRSDKQTQAQDCLSAQAEVLNTIFISRASWRFDNYILPAKMEDQQGALFNRRPMFVTVKTSLP